jgi:hypothetical protein
MHNETVTVGVEFHVNNYMKVHSQRVCVTHTETVRHNRSVHSQLKRRLDEQKYGDYLE